MNQNVSMFATAFIVMMLLFSLVELLTVNNASAGLFGPDETPEGYRIYSNGTFTVPNLQREGNVYTLTADINGAIVIESNNIVLDGAGYALSGQNSSTGIWLEDKNSVVIKNLQILNFSCGIRFSHYTPGMYSGEKNPLRTTDCTIQNCTITHNQVGISLDYTVNCNVLSNYVADNTQGITLSGVGSTFRNNRIDNNRYNFWDTEEEDNDVDDSNTVNGRPIIYWVNKSDLTVPSNAGLVILKKCEGIAVRNLQLSGHGVGLTLYYTNNSEITGNNISDNYWRGLSVWWSHNNSIVGNHITNNERYGIENYEATNNTIAHNLIKNNKDTGIYDRAFINSYNAILSNQIISNGGGIFGIASYCLIKDNYVFENSGGGISVDSFCIIENNNVTSNGPKTTAFQGPGIFVRNNCTVTGNYIRENNHGLWSNDGSGNVITKNTILYSNNEGIRFQNAAENNLIHHNNFIDNNNNGIQATVNDHFNVPAHNAWDNGSEGNYWSNYIYAGQQNGNSTVGNTTYNIAVNNQDRYPLLNPVDFEALEVPTVPDLTLTNTADPTPPPTDTPTVTPTPTQTPSQTEDPSQTTTEPDKAQTQIDPFLPIVAIAIIIAIFATGLLIFLKKSNRI